MITLREVFGNLTFPSFETWYKKASTGLTISSFLEDQLPPNDVVMVWHAYLLNPGFVYPVYTSKKSYQFYITVLIGGFQRIARDFLDSRTYVTKAVFSLNLLQVFPIPRLAFCVFILRLPLYQARLGQIMAEEPSLSRVKSWSDKQTVAFDPLDAMSQLSHKTITCPQCRKQVDCRA